MKLKQRHVLLPKVWYTLYAKIYKDFNKITGNWLHPQT